MAAEPADDRLAALLDREAIGRVQRAYADGVTRRDWAQVVGLFLPDATVSLDLVDRPARSLTGPDDLVAFVAGAIERFAFFEFVILNAVVDVWPDGDRQAATGRIFMCELRQDHGAAERTDAYGRYEDEYRRVEGVDGYDGWRIAARRYRSMARYPSGEVFPLP